MRGFPTSREAVRRSRGVPGPLGRGASSAPAAIAGMGWVAGADLVRAPEWITRSSSAVLAGLTVEDVPAETR
jgi:hypothetical protein